MKSSYNRNVGFADLGVSGEVSFGKMIDYLQDCSNRQSYEMGVGIEYQKKKGRAWILNSWHIDFREMQGEFLKDCEEVTVSTWPYEFNRLFGIRNYSIARKDSLDKYIVKAQARWFLYDMKSDMIGKITDEDKKTYSCVDEKLELPEVPRKIKAGSSYEEKSKFIVRKYQLDINNHMNNAWYVKLAEEFVENKENVKYLRVEYKNSAKLGDEVIPFVCYDTDRTVVELRNTDNNIYAISEFVY